MTEIKLKRLIVRHPQYKAFVTFLKREATVKLRPSTIANNLEQLESMRNKHGLNLKSPDVQAVFDSMETAGISAATMNMRRHTLKMWLKFKKMEIDDGLFKHKSGERVRMIHPADLLSIEDIEDIVTHTNSPALRAFFWCMYDTAARPGALCALNISDVVQDRHGYVFTFRNTKTEQSKRPVRMLIPTAIGYLEQWYAVHPRRDDPSAPLFISKRGNRYVPAGLTSTLKMRHQERLGKNLNMYLFRKSRATHLLREKCFNEIEVKTRLGHKKHSQMLEQYYAILDEEDQSEAELRYLGVAPEVEGPPQPILCPNCGAPNDAGTASCLRCRLPLSEEENIRQQEQRGGRTEALEQRIAELEERDKVHSVFLDKLREDIILEIKETFMENEKIQIGEAIDTLVALTPPIDDYDKLTEIRESFGIKDKLVPRKRKKSTSKKKKSSTVKEK